MSYKSARFKNGEVRPNVLHNKNAPRYRQLINFLMFASLLAFDVIAETPSHLETPTISIEYEEVYGTDAPNILVDQKIFKKYILSSSGTYQIKKIGEDKSEVIDLSLDQREIDILKLTAKGLLKIPEDNPWSKDYLWDDIKTYTIAKVKIIESGGARKDHNKTTTNHDLEIVIKIRDSDLIVKSIEDIPIEVSDLRKLIKDKERTLRLGGSQG